MASEAKGSGQATRLMAAINVSPESFHGGSVARGKDALRLAVQRAEAAGASLIDIGAQSTAPYLNSAVDEEEELARVRRALPVVRAATALPVSIDTQRAAVAAAALELGATVVNDVSGLMADPAMAEVAGGAECVILMANGDHVDWPACAGLDPIAVVAAQLRRCLELADAACIPRARITLDPGVGFFRSAPVPGHDFDVELIARVAELRALGCPLLVGASRKSFLGRLLGERPPEGRLAASLAIAAWCAGQGVEWLRVHDVEETADVLVVLRRLAGR